MLAQAKMARERVAVVRGALKTSNLEEIAGCLPLLEEAIGCLHQMPAAPPDAELRSELEALRFDVGVVRRLAEGGAEFYRNWARVLATTAAGYTPAGEPAALAARGSISVEG